MHTEVCRTLENKKVAPGHFVLTLSSSKIAPAAKPGKFVQILCSDSYEPFLPRPFSFLEASAKRFSILYQVVGKGTALLEQLKKGEEIRVLGPLGTGFSEKTQGPAVLVGGGVGIPPLYHLAQALLRSKKAKDIVVLLGARHKTLLLCGKDFRKLGVDLRVATDDGSKGKKGFVTDLLKNYLNTAPKRPKLFACGPTPMLKAVSKISVDSAVPSEISVEVPMACGFGACLGCAIKIKDQKTEDRGQKAEGYRFAIACCEGPVFDGQKILWS